jgi:hypothetical protein
MPVKHGQHIARTSERIKRRASLSQNHLQKISRKKLSQKESAVLAGVNPADVTVVPAVNHVQPAVGCVAEHQCRRIRQFQLHHRHRNGQRADRVSDSATIAGESPAAARLAAGASSGGIRFVRRGRMIRSKPTSAARHFPCRDDRAGGSCSGGRASRSCRAPSRRPGSHRRPRRAPAATRPTAGGSSNRHRKPSPAWRPLRTPRPCGRSIWIHAFSKTEGYALLKRCADFDLLACDLDLQQEAPHSGPRYVDGAQAGPTLLVPM